MEFQKKLDDLLISHDLYQAKDHIENSLEAAILAHDDGLILTILNEAIGFFRDISDYETSVRYAKSLLTLLSKLSLPSDVLFISYINVGNAFRAAKNPDAAITYFEKAEAIYKNDKLSLVVEYAALLNNKALAYEAIKNYQAAVTYLIEALKIIETTKDYIKMATTNTNIAECYINLCEFNAAKASLLAAKTIFDDNKNDFHYGFYKGVEAKYYNAVDEIDLAITSYKEALANISMHAGHCEMYNILLDELKDIYDKKNLEFHTKGIKLAKDYYESIKDEFLNSISPHLQRRITIGLFGQGSECYGMDDFISEDHDFSPELIVLVEDSVSDAGLEIIEEAYKRLPKIYDRFYFTPNPRRGVHKISEYLYKYLFIYDKENISEHSKSLLTNGAIFFAGGATSFLEFRKEVENSKPYDFVLKLAIKTLEINQYFPYNIMRASDRKDFDSAYYLLNHCQDRIIEYAYIINKTFLPHDKLHLPILKKMDSKEPYLSWIKALRNSHVEDVITEIPEHLIFNLYTYGIIKRNNKETIEDYHEEIDQFIDDYKKKMYLVPEIIKLEYEMFTNVNNIGGRADCQDNYPYFKLMREAQYYTWNPKTLQSYLEDLNTAKQNNINLIAIKYGFMERSTDPVNFDTIKDRLPVLSEKRLALQEEIIKVQVASMEEFASEFPEEANRMRSIHSESDSLFQTSYETYLRGELSCVSERTLYLYGRMLSEYDNIVAVTVAYTYLFQKKNVLK